MASPLALSSVCQAVATLLDDAAAAPAPIGFGVAADFSLVGANTVGTIVNGAGIYPYRVNINGTYRRPPGTLQADGRQRLPKLPVDLHFVILVRAADEATQIGLAGWILRKLEDHPVLPLALLNQGSDVFLFGESVEVGFADVPHEELLHLKEVIGPSSSDLFALPYVARSIAIDSALDEGVYAEVQERDLRYGFLKQGAAT